ncbi:MULTISPECIES: DUF1240 domain-containing protein [Providencia]|uniref:DUF1240 domain-containing protein n=2 Tax=Providencia TaxID=586 RepID=UPI001BAD7D7F|nr:DUF1240 domain-containing protein [Providencia rettgeri]MBS0875707.1 DUF1240 domain-containing protein [Providencia rettgeri]MBS0922855.1 DUF1240 domain-containing protein [Providencia rettgeri]QZY66522.1 DUF1240 domain-containing protein [Providencia rettgeri]
MPKWAMLLLGILLFIVCFLISILIYDYVLSLFQMKDIIIFSGPIAMCAIGFPTVLYALGGSVYSIVFNRLPKYNKIIFKYLMYLLFLGIFSGVPIAFAVNYYLKDEGYLTCDRISWMSPTTYVKNISLCD